MRALSFAQTVVILIAGIAVVILAARIWGAAKITFPADSNGDVFRRMQAGGDTFTKERDIDFNHIFQNEEDSKRFSEAARRLGYERVFLSPFKEKNAWDVRVTVFMLPKYDEVTRTEKALEELARKHAGRSDGWGCELIK